MAKEKLTDEMREFIVQALACFDVPSAVAASVKEEFGLSVSRQSVEAYDPTKRAGRNLARRWREIFAATRATFLSDTADIAVSHRAVRLRRLQRMSDKAEEMRNLPLAAQLLEQAAKEMGNAFTNRREVMGKDGGPIHHAVSAQDLTDEQLAAIIAGSGA